MKLKSVLFVGALSLAGLSLAGCGDASDTTATTTATAEPSAYEVALNDAIAACHAGVAETDGWRELDSGAMYELAKDVVKANNAEANAAEAETTETSEAETAEETTRPIDSRYVIAKCTRNMTAYAGGGEAPAGITAE